MIPVFWLLGDFVVTPGAKFTKVQFHKSADGRGKFRVWFTDNAQIKEQRRSQIISIMTSANTHHCATLYELMQEDDEESGAIDWRAKGKYPYIRPCICLQNKKTI